MVSKIMHFVFQRQSRCHGVNHSVSIIQCRRFLGCFLRDMLLKFYKQKQDDPLKDIFWMGRGPLIEEVRSYLQQKRYVIVFGDVWSVHFWDDFEYATIDNKVLITTRNIDVNHVFH